LQGSNWRAIGMSPLALLAIPLSALAEPIDKEKIWQDNKNSIVQIHAFGTGANGSPKSVDAGTGVFVSANGYILTALHVVGADADWQQLPDGSVDRKIQIIGLNKNAVPYVISKNGSARALPGLDAALLRVDGACFQHSSISGDRPQGFPTLVALAWGVDGVPHPSSADLTTTDVQHNGDNLTIEKITAVEGDSGSPLFNATERVVGLLIKRVGNDGALAVPMANIAPLLPADVTSNQAGAYPLECYSSCALPENGVGSWGGSATVTEDTGWRGGGYDPTSFCAAQKLRHEQANPTHFVTVQALPEQHQSIYNPFKHDEYRYQCAVTDQWDPVYKVARSPSCPLN
jgi:Trypsin-like peptidase domain